MKTVLYALPCIFLASAALAHEGAFPHAHLEDPSWLPVLAGMLVIAGAATVAWLRK
jgi:hypothetical protein